MIYIKYGPPDEREEHRSGGAYQRPIEEGGGQTSTFPFEKWRYRYIEGIGKDVTIEFVDTNRTGDFHITMDPAEKDALLYVPGTGLTLVEQIGLASKEDRFTRTDGTRLGTGAMPLPANCAANAMDCFQRLQEPAPNPFENVPRAAPPATSPKTPKAVVAPEDAIEDIVFQGARRVSQDLLRFSIVTKKGDKFDKDALDRDLVTLWNTKRFSDIRWTSERGKTGWIVNFTVVETPPPPRN
jgi:hypothetical protein